MLPYTVQNWKLEDINKIPNFKIVSGFGMTGDQPQAMEFVDYL